MTWKSGGEVARGDELHRWYDAGVGRWLSQDPIGFAAGDANLYRYVGNGATEFTDPSGLSGKGIKETQNNDGSTTITITHPNTLVILYGHGNKEAPHTFIFDAENTFGVFVGCDAGATNSRIPKDHAFDTAKTSNGDLINGGPNVDKEKTTRFYKDKHKEEAITKAHAILDEDKDVSKVRILTILEGTGWAPGLNTWNSSSNAATEPLEEDVIVTRNGPNKWPKK